jgi:Cu+-exporting ATPase
MAVQEIVSRIEKIGYGASEQKQDEKKNYALAFAILFSAPLIWTMLAHFGLSQWLLVPDWLMNPWFQFGLAAPVQFWIGYPFYRSAWLSIVSKVLNMDVLVVMGTTTAFVYSVILSVQWQFSEHHMHMLPSLYFETSAVLLTLILVGKALEAKAKGRASLAIQKLLGLQAKMAIVVRDGVEVEVPIADVIIDDWIRLKPGDKVPVDGELVEGDTYIDESMLTGESKPVHKVPGDYLYCATLNGHFSVLMRAKKIGKQTLLAQIVKTVSEAQASKAPIQRYADRISGVFVPIVIGIALVTFALTYFVIARFNLAVAIEHAIAVLVIACPCALGLATPVSILAGTGRAAEQGILFRGGATLEQAYLADVIVFDKTGTITTGKPTLVHKEIVGDGLNEKEIFHAVHAVESRSEHPISKAILAGLSESNDSCDVQQFQALPGYGVEGWVNGNHYIIGNSALMEKHQVTITKARTQIEVLENQAMTVVYVGMNQTLVAILAVTDAVKHDVVHVVKELQQLNKEIVVMTGDNPRTAAAIVNKVGIQKWYADLKPQDKVNLIKEMQTNGRKVMMVGDGINDSPALAMADIGVAMGEGADIAIESAGITLLKGDLSKLRTALVISEKTMFNIRQNLVWALVYNVIGIPFAALGYLTPWIAGAAMTFSSISVVLNALRLQKL